MLLELDAGEMVNESEELWALFDLLNIACGGHAGDRASMQRVVGFCADSARQAGAHPSYPDREHFGRRSIAIEPDALAQTIEQQCRALAEVAHTRGVTIRHVKPHGALYHDAVARRDLADAVVRGATAALGRGITIIGFPRGALVEAAQAAGVGYAREGFADRRTRADGTLVPRSEPDALVTDPAAAARRATELAGQVDALCIHADTPGALAIARAVRRALHG